MKESMGSGFNHTTGMSGKVGDQKVTYSTLANIPRAKIQKIISESKPLVILIF